MGTIRPSSTSTDGAAVGLTCSGEPVDPGPAPMRRLTPLEYRNTVAMILSVDVSGFEGDFFPPDSVVDGFDNNAEALSITIAQARPYQTAAENIAAQIVSDETKRSALVGDCDPANRQDCLRPFIERVGRQLFRRPLESVEVDALLALADLSDGTDAYDAVNFVLQGLLQAPQFLFRVEQGQVNAEREDLAKLTGYEMACRLAFLLWQSGPDQTLLDAAEAGEFDTVEGIQSRAERMMSDERAKATMHVFASQWLRITELQESYFEKDIFPAYTETLKSSAIAELSLLLDDYLWSDANAFELYTSSHTYVNHELGALYDLPASGAEFERVELGQDNVRSGLFGTAVYAMVTSRPTTTSVVYRGKYVRDVVLCDPLPPPPDNIDPTISDRLNTEPCKGCHTKMDTIGQGVSMLDALGALPKEEIIVQDYAGYVLEGSEQHTFSGSKELGEVLASSQKAQHCVVTQYLRWGLGRSMAEADACTQEQLSARFLEDGSRFQKLILDLVGSDAFRFRHPVKD